MNKLFLPFGEGDDPAFHWLCFHMKGKFTYHAINGGSDIFFKSEKDMQYFILMWGEYL